MSLIANPVAYDSLAQATAAHIPPGYSSITLNGYYAAGDSPAALYVTASAGAGSGKFQSADGQWWALAPLTEGWPEWFGAQPGNPSFDCSASILACIAYFPTTRMSGQDYWIASTLIINTPNRLVIGTGFNGNGSNPATRIVLASASMDIVQIGPNSQPGSTSGFLQGVRLNTLTLARTVAPNLPPAPPTYNGGVSGLRVQWSQYCYIENVYSNESINGFYITGNIACYYRNIHAARTLTATSGGAGPDRYFGVFLDSSPTISGLANGNASVYFDYFSSSTSISGQNSFVYTYGGFTDTYWMRGECSGHASGFILNGTTNSDTGTPTEDCHISNCIMDGLTLYGFFINAMNLGGSLMINQCYTANPTGYGVYVYECLGEISIVNSQIGGTPATTGLFVIGSSGVTTTNNNFVNHGIMQVWQDSFCCECAGDTLDYANYAASSAGTVQIISTSRSIWRGKIKGAANAVIIGIAMTKDGTGAACDYNEINCTGIDPAVVTGGSGNKLQINSLQVTVTGLTTSAASGFNHNLVAGVMN